eukprot:4559831-Pleurochrysis_carterae.AAC.1
MARDVVHRKFGKSDWKRRRMALRTQIRARMADGCSLADVDLMTRLAELLSEVNSDTASEDVLPAEEDEPPVEGENSQAEVTESPGYLIGLKCKRLHGNARLDVETCAIALSPGPTMRRPKVMLVEGTELLHEFSLGPSSSCTSDDEAG